DHRGIDRPEQLLDALGVSPRGEPADHGAHQHEQDKVSHAGRLRASAPGRYETLVRPAHAIFSTSWPFPARPAWSSSAAVSLAAASPTTSRSVVRRTSWCSSARRWAAAPPARP